MPFVQYIKTVGIQPGFVCLCVASLLALMPVTIEAQIPNCEQQFRASELPASGCNRAFSLHVLDMQFFTHLDGEAAPPGQQWLTINLRFDNWITADLIFKLGYQEALLVGSLARQLYLLVDGSLVVRPQLPEGAPSDDSFLLARSGAQQSVQVAFAIPEGECTSLSLSYHHNQFADIVIPLVGEVPDSSRQRQLAHQQAGNDVMSLGVHDASIHESWLGVPAPDGMKWLVADLRGQSEWQTDIDALALRRDAGNAEKDSLRRVMEYVGADVMLQAVVDGHYGYVRDKHLSSLQESPPWLTYAWAGGKAVFAIPDSAQQVELVAYFGEFIAEGIASQDRPPFRFSISEGRPINEGTASGFLTEISDNPTPVTLYGINKTEKFAEHQAGDDESLLIFDVSMANTSDEGGMMSVIERFRIETADGQLLEPLDVYLPGPIRFNQPFFLPPADERRFKLVYRLNDRNIAPELVYAGVSVNDRVPLAPLEVN